MALGLTQPLAEIIIIIIIIIIIFIYCNWVVTRWQWVPGIFPGGKGGRCVGLTTLPPSCADCLEIWEHQLPGTLRACPGL